MNNVLYNSNSVNWSEKVRLLDENIRKEMGIDEENQTKNILIKVQTKSAQIIEPAFIVGEDETFLDLFVLSGPNGGSIISTAVLKNNIQSVGVIGGLSAKRVDPTNRPAHKPVLEDIGGLYQ